MLKKLISGCLRALANNVEEDNCNISEEEFKDIAKMLDSLNAENSYMSKYAAYHYLNVSRATFDNYIREGKIPKGKKRAGFKELSWAKKDLNDFIAKRKNK